jgi:glycerophosphoryl diester phosphodiesterase
MIIISHRGNLEGPSFENENTPQCTDKALNLGFDVELDIWVLGDEIYLGHDQPILNISLDFLKDRKEHLWLHLKNFQSADFFFGLTEFNFFSHENDPYVITSKGFVWSYPGKCLSEKKIVLMPEWNVGDQIHGATGICTDYPIRYKTELLQSN